MVSVLKKLTFGGHFEQHYCAFGGFHRKMQPKRGGIGDQGKGIGGKAGPFNTVIERGYRELEVGCEGLFKFWPAGISGQKQHVSTGGYVFDDAGRQP